MSGDADVYEELGDADPVHVIIGPHHAYYLAAVLNRDQGRRGLTPEERRAVTWLYEHVRLHFRNCPAVLDALDRGITGGKT